MDQKTTILMPGSGDKPYPTLDALLRNFGTEAGTAPEYLMFGDSVAERVSRADADQRTLVAMIADELAPARLLGLTRSAHHPLIYRWLLSALALQPNRPRLLILPINPRCFSPQWHLNPDWQLDQELHILRRYSLQQLRTIPPLRDVHADPVKRTEFERMPVQFDLSEHRTIGDFRKVIRRQPETDGERARRIRDIFIFHYTYRLDSSHPRLQDLKEALAIASQLIDKVVVYITPVNIDAAVRAVGPSFLRIFHVNVRTICDVADEVGVKVADWSEALPESAFFHEDTATEHLNQIGRRELARMVSAGARSTQQRSTPSASST